MQQEGSFRTSPNHLSSGVLELRVRTELKLQNSPTLKFPSFKRGVPKGRGVFFPVIASRLRLAKQSHSFSVIPLKTEIQFLYLNSPISILPYNGHSECIFRFKPAGDSDSNLPVIPIQTCHPLGGA